MTDDSAFKKQIRARMAETGENYTVARRAVIAARDRGQRWPVALKASGGTPETTSGSRSSSKRQSWRWLHTSALS